MRLQTCYTNWQLKTIVVVVVVTCCHLQLPQSVAKLVKTDFSLLFKVNEGGVKRECIDSIDSNYMVLMA